MYIIWAPAAPKKITGRIMRTMDKLIAAFVIEHHRRPCCGICLLDPDGREVVEILFEPYREPEDAAA